MKPDLDQRVREAVRHFWKTRASQRGTQKKRGVRDQGARSATTGGKQLDGFVSLIAQLVQESGVDDASVHLRKSDRILPGFFRPTKEWDLIVAQGRTLLATIEFKFQVGPSFGNNFNNRAEEAIGNATDFWTAYREGAFKPSSRPWLGYLFLLEDAPESQSPVSVSEPHFPVLDGFRGASYAERYQILCQRLVRERLYDAACLILSKRSAVRGGGYSEPDPELGFGNFARSLRAHAAGFAILRP